MKFILSIFIITILVSCNGSADSNSTPFLQPKSKDTVKQKVIIDKDDSATFYPLKYDLYINKKGEIAYRAFDQTVPGDVRDVFLRYVNNFDTVNHQRREIEFVVDTASFEPLDDLYYRDKRFAYYHFPMMDGGFFDIIREADPKTLKVFGESWYAKDRRHIFCR